MGLLSYLKESFYKKTPIFTQTYTDHPEKQICEVRCYCDEVYTHTVNILYFTKEQAKELQDAQEKICTKSRELRERKRLAHKKKKNKMKKSARNR